jgi:hypothetical protein
MNVGISMSSSSTLLGGGTFGRIGRAFGGGVASLT